MYAKEKRQKGGISAQKVVDIVNEEFNTDLLVRSIHRYAKMDMAGESPLKSGPEGRIPEFSIKFLASALDPYIRIEQGNGKAISRNIPPSKVNKTVAVFQKNP